MIRHIISGSDKKSVDKWLQIPKVIVQVTNVRQEKARRS
jgi:hypothetical protein